MSFRPTGLALMFRARSFEVAVTGMVKIDPICVEVEREADGRVLGSVPELPGVMAYGGAETEAIRKVKSVALQVLADMVANDEEIPLPLKLLFAV